MTLGSLWASGGVVGPPQASISLQLLHGGESSAAPCNEEAQTWTRSHETSDRPSGSPALVKIGG
jgi:hypothetical protein